MNAKTIKFVVHLVVALAAALHGITISPAAETEITQKNAGRSVQDITAALSYYKPDTEVARSAYPLASRKQRRAFAHHRFV